MKQFIYSTIASMTFVFAASIAQAHVEEMDYRVGAAQTGSNLLVVMTETKTDSALCDLVVEKMEYFSDLQMLDVRVVPTQFCAVDAIGSRKAMMTWQLPQELRSAAKIKLRINGVIASTIVISSQSVDVIGGAQ